MEPQIDADERGLNQITERIIGCAYDIGNVLGPGFLEKCYETALMRDLQRAGYDVKSQHPIRVFYKNEEIGFYCADLLVEECVIVELKAGKGIDDVHMAQCLNYLRATGLKLCLLINFGKAKVDIRRIVNNF
ncbi:GxxExxY protein [soil metagenome]